MSVWRRLLGKLEHKPATTLFALNLITVHTERPLMSRLPSIVEPGLSSSGCDSRSGQFAERDSQRKTAQRRGLRPASVSLVGIHLRPLNCMVKSLSLCQTLGNCPTVIRRTRFHRCSKRSCELSVKEGQCRFARERGGGHDTV
jgi:hypothetical protein